MINKAHGIMFHHFYDADKHIQAQGAINTNDFRKILYYLKANYNLISADEWTLKSINKSLEKKDICITFDDNLLCQFDIALPVLKEFNLKAFWFIYSSPLVGVIEKLELYRYFRSSHYNTINDFYIDFNNHISNSNYTDLVENKLKNYDETDYLSQFSFYSLEDKKFRYIRDEILGQSIYYELMDNMLEKNNVNIKSVSELLWMRPEQIKILSNEGHIIGLHSHTHPTALRKLNKEQQYKEYDTNHKVLSSIINTEINTMAHPNGSYSKETLELLSSRNIKVGFRSDFEEGFDSVLEYPRIDHAYLMKKLL
tara:strand:+ start:6289 stop:7221 length:933 start_codon:yes stop_codon:yes gene_type:complete